MKTSVSGVMIRWYSYSLGCFPGGETWLRDTDSHVSNLHPKRGKLYSRVVQSHFLAFHTVFTQYQCSHLCELQLNISITTDYVSCTVTVLKILHIWSIETLCTVNNTWAHLSNINCFECASLGKCPHIHIRDIRTWSILIRTKRNNITGALVEGNDRKIFHLWGMKLVLNRYTCWYNNITSISPHHVLMSPVPLT